MGYIAKCHCGDVTLACEGEPDPIVMCHCELCQRRTGSLFGIAAWFGRTSVKITGVTTEYTRTTGDANLPFTFNFCPGCGTSIWWLPARADGALKGKIAIAGGCFTETPLPEPTLSIYEKHRHACVVPPKSATKYHAGL